LPSSFFHHHLESWVLLPNPPWGHFSIRLLTTSDSVRLINSFHVMATILAPLLGVLFLGGISPSKIGLIAPPIASQYKPFQKRVSSCWVKRSPGCVVWAAPTLLRDEPFLIMEEQPFSTLTRGAESNPARVLWQEVCHD
jgi:hypothetical protein